MRKIWQMSECKNYQWGMRDERKIGNRRANSIKLVPRTATENNWGGGAPTSNSQKI